MEIFGLVIAASTVSLMIAFGLLAAVAPFLWLWMFIDSLLRQEHEYPGATATSSNRLLWVLLIALTQIAAIPYFFMVYGKVRRGTVPQPPLCEPVAA